MCLYPRIIRNPKYKPNKKNGGNVPTPEDPRELSVAIGCGVCYECLKQKGNWWAVRQYEEIKRNKMKGYMVTLTFSDEALIELQEAASSEDGNKIATLAVRRFLERWRKLNKKSVRHWLVTEHGHKATERIHLHGILWTDVNIREGMTKLELKYNKRNTTSYLAEVWGYGNVHIGKYVNEATASYITKYVTKRDEKHPGYVPVILCSPGIGAGYAEDRNSKFIHRWQDRNTTTKYTNRTGREMGLPIYYRNKLFNEKQRTSLWMYTLDKNERWVMGTRIDISKGEAPYFKKLEWAQRENIRMGFQSPIGWRKEIYKAQRTANGLIENKEQFNDILSESIDYIWNYNKNINTFESETHTPLTKNKDHEKEDEFTKQLRIKLFLSDWEMSIGNLKRRYHELNPWGERTDYSKPCPF